MSNGEIVYNRAEYNGIFVVNYDWNVYRTVEGTSTGEKVADAVSVARKASKF